VLCETGGSTEVAPCCHVFFIAGGELSSCLSDVRFVAVGASQFVYPRSGVSVMSSVFVGE
jgi:hypothetical protein